MTVLKSLVDEVQAVTGTRKLYVTVTEAALIVGLDRRSVWRDIVAGELPAEKRGKPQSKNFKYLVHVNDLDAYRRAWTQ